MMQLYHLPEGPKEPADFCCTPAAEEMLQVIDLAIRYRRLGAIIAPPGAGKTTALQHYAKTRAGAHYCVMSPTTKSMSSMLELVSNSLHCWAFRGNLTMEKAICDEMKRSRFQVLLVDEAQHLSEKCLDELRCIYDMTEKTPIVFAGNYSLRERVTAGRESAFSQLTSRIGARLHLKEISAADVDALATHHGITDVGAVAWLRKQCAGTTGGLRRLECLLEVAHDMGDGKIGLTQLKEAAAALGGAS